MVSLIYTTRLSICPIRLKPSDSALMISQLLFGEEVELLQNKKGSWSQVKCASDGLIGWIDSKQLIKLETPSQQKSIVVDLVESVFADSNSTSCTMGAELPDYDGMTCRINGKKYRYSGSAVNKETLVPNLDSIEKVARRFLNTPFLQGGRSPFGLDSSGYTQLVFKCCGIELPRHVEDQAMSGETIDFMASAQLGDIGYFTTDSERISHAGIILQNNHIIHPYGYVRIDKLDHYGIYNVDISQYTHRLKIIKRYL